MSSYQIHNLISASTAPLDHHCHGNGVIAYIRFSNEMLQVRNLRRKFSRSRFPAEKVLRKQTKQTNKQTQQTVSSIHNK